MWEAGDNQLADRLPQAERASLLSLLPCLALVDPDFMRLDHSHFSPQATDPALPSARDRLSATEALPQGLSRGDTGIYELDE